MKSYRNASRMENVYLILHFLVFYVLLMKQDIFNGSTSLQLVSLVTLFKWYTTVSQGQIKKSFFPFGLFHRIGYGSAINLKKTTNGYQLNSTPTKSGKVINWKHADEHVSTHLADRIHLKIIPYK